MYLMVGSDMAQLMGPYLGTHLGKPLYYLIGPLGMSFDTFLIH
jgi:hypothetical protein